MRPSVAHRSIMSVSAAILRIGFFTAAGLLLSSAFALGQQVDVRWSDGRLSVAAHDAPLAEVLLAIAHQTGIQVTGLDRAERSRSIEFSDQSLTDGLKLVLEGIDYFMAGPGLPEHATNPSVRIWLYLGSPPDLDLAHGNQGHVPLEAPSAAAAGFLPEDAAPSPIATNHEPVLDVTESTNGDITEIAQAPDADPELQQLEASRFFDEANQSAIFQATKSENAAVRVRSLRALAERDSALSADAIGIAMVDADPAVSSVAAVLMAESNAPRTLENLASVLQHPDPVIRFNALELLERRDDPDSLPYVQDLLTDENETIRKSAEELVERLKSRAGRRESLKQ